MLRLKLAFALLALIPSARSEAQVASLAELGPSGQTLVVRFKGPDGKVAAIQSIAEHPTIRPGRRARVSLAVPGPVIGAGYLLYVLPAGAPPDAILLDAPAGWAITTAGPAPAIAGLHVPPMAAPDRPDPTMPAGVNVAAPTYFDAGATYANRVRQAPQSWSPDAYTRLTLTASGEIGRIEGVVPGRNGSATLLLWAPAASGVGSPDRGYPVLRDGEELILRWDGDAKVSLRSSHESGSLAEIEHRPGTGGVGNLRRYRLKLASGRYHAYVQLLVTGPGSATNLDVREASIPDGWSSRFHPTFVERLKTFQAIRFMDALSTNSANVTTAAELMPDSIARVGTPGSRSIAITSVAPDLAEPNGYFTSLGGRTPLLCTTAAPHGLVTGQTLTFDGFTANLFFTDGLSVSLNGLWSPIRVTGPDTFVAVRYVGANKPFVPQALTGRASLRLNNGFPVEDAARLCNEADADAWLCVPHLLDDDGVRAIARRFFAVMGPGRKVRVEYSNEPWNYAISFAQHYYFRGEGAIRGLAWHQYYVRRAAEVQALFRAEAVVAGRPKSDVIRVLNSQAAAPSVTAAYLTEAAARGLEFDEIGVAPYYWGGPANNGAAWEVMTADQASDASAYNLTAWNGFGNVAGHAAVIRARSPASRLVCYEGGFEQLVPTLGGFVSAGTKSRAVSRHPGAYDQTFAYLAGLQAAGSTLFMQYDLQHHLASVSAKYGTVWGVYNASAWQAPGKGDGSDGLFDNRTGYDELVNVVSPVGLAFKGWNQSLVAAPSEPVPPADQTLEAGGLAWTSTPATWQRSGLGGLYAVAPASARWSIATEPGASYRVYASWTDHPNRVPAATYELQVLDGYGGRRREWAVILDQRGILPYLPDAMGARYPALGEFVATSRWAALELTAPAPPPGSPPQVLSAVGVRVERIALPPAAPVDPSDPGALDPVQP